MGKPGCMHPFSPAQPKFMSLLEAFSKPQILLFPKKTACDGAVLLTGGPCFLGRALYPHRNPKSQRCALLPHGSPRAGSRRTPLPWEAEQFLASDDANPWIPTANHAIPGALSLLCVPKTHGGKHLQGGAVGKRGGEGDEEVATALNPRGSRQPGQLDGDGYQEGIQDTQEDLDALGAEDPGQHQPGHSGAHP